jgi:hypothetical protein
MSPPECQRNDGRATPAPAAAALSVGRRHNADDSRLPAAGLQVSKVRQVHEAPRANCVEVLKARRVTINTRRRRSITRPARLQRADRQRERVSN